MDSETIEDKIKDVLLAELQRQSGSGLNVSKGEEGTVKLDGVLNLDDVAMAIAGSLAGGP